MIFDSLVAHRKNRHTMATIKTKTATASKTPTRAAEKPASSEPAKITPIKPATAPEPAVVASSQPVVTQPDLKKRELIDMVVERSGVKKKDAKPAIEALLAILGETVAEGRELNLPPFGKLRVNRTQERSNGRVIVCRLRQNTPNDLADKEPSEQIAEDE